MNFDNRAAPWSFDVLLVVALDVRESHGVDICSDIRNFLSKGLSVGIVLLTQGSHLARYRNASLIKMAFEMGIPLLGHRDVSKTQLAIVYNPELFMVREVRGRFLAQRVWVVLDQGQFDAFSVAEIGSKVSAHCDSKPSFVAVTASGQQSASAQTGERVELWNFHAGDRRAEERQDVPPLPAPRRIGIPTPTKYSREIIVELKILASLVGRSTGNILCARTSVPPQLQAGDGEGDPLVGFPFMTKDRDRFLGSLSMYVVPLTMLSSETWKDDVYACMRLGVPLGLPQALQPYFGPAASYYEVSASELLLETSLDQPGNTQNILEYAREAYRERTYSESWAILLAVGLGPGIPALLNENKDKGHKPAVPAPLPGSSGNLPGGRRSRVCFVTSNGAGMGHLTRLLAVARRLDDDIEASFVSMSQACGVVTQYGYDFEYIPSKGDLLVDAKQWNQYFNKRFMEALERLSPDVVVFDGTWPYQGISKAVETYDAKFVWMRRGMWRAETASTSLVRNTKFDLVVEPGDIASPYDQGPTSQACDAYKVDPIIVLDPSEISGRERARQVLGLGPEENAMLITLGAGNINKIDEDVKDVILAVKALPENWRIFMTNPLIAENVDVTEGVENISIYPLARCAKAFDFVVSATGYNSFHEWIAYSIPTLWIANANTATDDQIGRARYAHDTGLGFAAGPGGSVSIPEAVGLLGQHKTRARMRETMDRVSFPNGAYSAADQISGLAKGGRNQ